jgi:FAD-linked oxidoreductase
MKVPIGYASGVEKPFTCWSRQFACTPAQRAAPGSEPELAELLGRAAAGGRQVKVVGAGHSMSDVAMTDGVLVSLDRMRSVVGVDAANQCVTVQGGARLYELVAALASRGLALSILGSIAKQSIAGAISTGTHGSSLRHRNLAGLVRAMRLVSAEGALLTLNDSDERLAAARVGLGALGVITEVTLQCEPLFRLAEQAQRVSIEPMLRERLARDLETLARAAEYVKIFWLPMLPFAQVYRYQRTDEPINASAIWRLLDEAVVNRLLFTALLDATRRWPALTLPINRVVGAAYFRTSQRVGRYDQVLTLPVPPVHREMEYAVALEQAPEALDRVRNLFERRRLRVNFVLEIRFAKGDDAWMSPAYGRDTCHIGAYMAESADIEEYFSAFEQIMQGLGGRPHWGKEHNVTPEYVRAVWPMAERFAELRRELDPRGVFDNACLRRALPPLRPATGNASLAGEARRH